VLQTFLALIELVKPDNPKPSIRDNTISREHGMADASTSNTAPPTEAEASEPAAPAAEVPTSPSPGVTAVTAKRAPSSGCEKLRNTVRILCQILSDQSVSSSPGGGTPGSSNSRVQSTSGTLSACSSTSSLKSLDCSVLEPSHWLEVADQRHRYGSALRPYYDAWLALSESSGSSGESFFHFLDEGAGKDLNLKEHEDHQQCRYRPRHPLVSEATRLKKKMVSRIQLESCRLEYCDATQRMQYIVRVEDGKLVWANDGLEWKANDVVHSEVDEKWIFVLDPAGNMYINRKVKGRFHHSCFLAGGCVRAAGRVVVDHGCIVSLAPYSGHYRPSPDSINHVVDLLAAAGLDTSAVQRPSWTLFADTTEEAAYECCSAAQGDNAQP
jgi:hypothetical protein